MTQTIPPVANVQATQPVNANITIQPVAPEAAGRNSTKTSSPLANLTNGTTVEGFVVNRDGQNNPILRTALGDLKVTSEVFLKTGSEVIIKVDASQAFLARIISVDGQTPQDYSAQSARGLTKDTISASALQPSLANLQAGKPGAAASAPQLQAIILQGIPQPVSTLATTLAAAQSGPVAILTQLAKLRPGTPIRLTLLDLKLPPLPVSLGSIPSNNSKLDRLLTPQPSASQPPTVQSREPIAQATTSSTQAAKFALTQAPEAPIANEPFIAKDELKPLQTAIQQRQAGTAAQFLVKTPENSLLQPRPEDARNQTQPTAPNQLVANVIGHDADGANILHTPFASLKMYTAQPMPSGTNLLLQVDIEPQHTPPTDSTPIATQNTFANPASTLTGELASLDEAIAWLATNHPDAARDVQQRLPVMGQKLASSMLFFIANIKQSGASEVFGKRALRLIELGAPDLLNRLRQDISRIDTGLNDSPLQNWTTLPLPMLFGQELVQARLYIGKPPEEEKAQSIQSHGQRFVLEVDMSHLGAMQFDGFVRSRDAGKTFDLMVRSDRPLTDDVTQGIRGIFENSLAITGLAGQVVFQHGSQYFVRPQAEMARGPQDDGNTILA
ncbi:MAG: hypothetical protein ACOYNL_04520 [Rickettsiales bacterium]